LTIEKDPPEVLLHKKLVRPTPSRDDINDPVGNKRSPVSLLKFMLVNRETIGSAALFIKKKRCGGFETVVSVYQRKEIQCQRRR
jgi:hypothetical protein